MIGLMSSCGSNKISLESSPLVNINEAYYQKWVSGVRGGGSGLNIHLSVDNKDLENKLIGLYFKDKYTTLKFNKPNVYTGFIRTSKREETNLDLPVKKESATLKEEKEYKLPFSIKENEAVVVILVNKRKKHFIITIKKKQTLDFPM
jgi:hypothetical protein